MTTQIAVRLPDAMVSFLNEAVAAGDAPSRAAVIQQALEREMRRRAAVRDAEILAQCDDDSDLDDLVAWSARTLAPPG